MHSITGPQCMYKETAKQKGLTFYETVFFFGEVYHSDCICSLFTFLNCRHAGVYTAEEVALITREKLIRLQSLYIDQFKRLQHLLKEKKRRYLHNRKVEHDTLGRYTTSRILTTLFAWFTYLLPRNLSCLQPPSPERFLYLFMLLSGSSLLTGPEGLSMKERENLKKLKALRRYRRRYGVEALLHRQLRERRQAVTEGASQVTPHHSSIKLVIITRRFT